MASADHDSAQFEAASINLMLAAPRGHPVTKSKQRRRKLPGACFICCQARVRPKDCGMNKILRVTGRLALAWFQFAASSAEAADVKAEQLPRFSDYRLVDSGLKVAGIDSDPTESFLALQLDSAGRLFAGGREALFVYEPAGVELYHPGQLLYRFPKNSWIYGIAIRGEDLYVSTPTARY